MLKPGAVDGENRESIDWQVTTILPLFDTIQTFKQGEAELI